MTDYIRRIVSGNKARFKDGHLNMDLDLVYLTDQIIIMGYPASGIEGLYRNNREDTKRENSYEPSFFSGRVSRYPFPDHHAPPLAIMPLLAREMRAWLNGSPERVAVLHCKAGKGRSGTMACTYLLSLGDTATPPKLERSYTAKQWAKIRAEDTMQVVPDDVDNGTNATRAIPPLSDIPEKIGPTSGLHDGEHTTPLSPASTTELKPVKSFTDSLKDVLDLHTSRRMKDQAPGKKVKQGVSIPSQRRWLYYWALLLAHEAPAHLWAIPRPPMEPHPHAPDKSTNPKIRLTQITLRMKETSGMKINLVRAANLVIDRTNLGKSAATIATASGKGHVWVSLARYDDELVELLERWEKHTRDERHMGWRKKGSDHMADEELNQLFAGGKWDEEKMVRSFARLGALGEHDVVKEGSEQNGKTVKYILRPLSDENWADIRDELQHDESEGPDPEDINVPASEANSMYDLTRGAKERGVVLDAGREVRVKLYMGQVFMGWLWFIPAFHMSQPPASGKQQTATKMVLTRKDIDFPLGIGSGIIDVEIVLEWLRDTDPEVVQPPARLNSEDEAAQGMASETMGVAATVQAAMAGTVGEVVEAKQADVD